MQGLKYIQGFCWLKGNGHPRMISSYLVQNCWQYTLHCWKFHCTFLSHSLVLHKMPALVGINIHVTVPIMLASLRTWILDGIIFVDIVILKECTVESYRHCTVIFHEFLVRPNRLYRKVTTFDTKTWRRRLFWLIIMLRKIDNRVKNLASLICFYYFLIY